MVNRASRDVDGTYQLAPGSKGNLDMRAVGEVDLAELREQMKLGMLPSQVQAFVAGRLGRQGTDRSQSAAIGRIGASF